MERHLLITVADTGATQTARKVISVSQRNVVQIIPQHASSEPFPFKLIFNLTHNVHRFDIVPC